MKSRHGILGVTVNVRDATAAQCARADKALRPLRERVGYTHTTAHAEIDGTRDEKANRLFRPRSTADASSTSRGRGVQPWLLL